jgi:CDP-4-dehydro-6-deoxyglucose reductase
MSFTITLLPSLTTFTASPLQTLLDAALAANQLVPYSCQEGECGVCRATLIEGQVSAEGNALLTAAEQASGEILICQARAQSDLRLLVREPASRQAEAIKPSYACRLIQKTLAHDVAILELALPRQTDFHFQAGQYIDIACLDGKMRSFSLASAPYDLTEKGQIALHIRQQVGGVFSDYVFNTLKTNDLLRFQGAKGNFVWQTPAHRSALMLASGTGFAPIFSIIRQRIHEKCDAPITVYWGANVLADLYLLEEAQALTQQYPHIRLIPVLSDAPDSDAWTGRRGLVHEAILADYTDLSQVDLYACGAPAMVEAAYTALTQMRQLPSQHFYSDVYVPKK